MIGTVQFGEVICKRVRGSECLQLSLNTEVQKTKSLIYKQTNKQNNNNYNHPTSHSEYSH